MLLSHLTSSNILIINLGIEVAMECNTEGERMCMSMTSPRTE